MDGMKGAPLSVLQLAAPICVHGPQARQGGTERSRGSDRTSQHKEATLESSAADISKETLIRAMFPPREWTDPDGNTWLSFPSSELPTRDSALRAHEHLERELKRRQARPEPLDDVREEIFAELFDELIRQIALLNPERGLLLLRVRDERRLTLLSLSALAQGGSRFGTNSVVRIRQRGKRAMERIGLQQDRIGHADTAVLAALDSTAAPGTDFEASGGEIVPLSSKASSKASEMNGQDAAGRLSSTITSGTTKPDHRGRGVLPARAALVTRLWPHNDAITRAAAEATAVERFGVEEAGRLFELVRRAAATDVLEGTAAAAIAGSARAAGWSGSGQGDDNDLVVLETPGKLGIGVRDSESGRMEGVGLAEGKDDEQVEVEGASTGARSAGAIASSLASALPVDPEEEDLSGKVVAVQRDVDSLRARKAELESLMQAVGARARARRYAAVRVAEQAEAEAQDEAGIGMGTSSGGGILGGATAGSSSRAPSALAAALRASDGPGGMHPGSRAGEGAGGEGAIMEQQLALQLQRRAQKARLESQIEALRTVLGRAAAAAAAAGDGDQYSDDGSDTGLDVATGLGPEPSLDSAVGLDH